MADKPFHIEYSTLEHSGRQGEIRAFIYDPVRLEDGDLVGAWHPFPCTVEEITATLREIGVNGGDFLIDGYETRIDGLESLLAETADLNELNYLASRLEGLDEYQRTVYESAIEGFIYSESLHRLIDLTGNLQQYSLNPMVTDAQTLGLLTFEIDEDEHAMSIAKLEESADPADRALAEYIGTLKSHFNVERYGLELHGAGNGHFTKHGYLEGSNAVYIENWYGGPHDIPDEYRVYDSDAVTQTISRQEQEARMPVKVEETDLSALVFKMHAVAGDFTSDIPFNVKALAEPGGQYYLMIENGRGIRVTDARLIYQDNEKMGVIWRKYPGDVENVRAYLLKVDSREGGRAFGTLLELDFAETGADVAENSISRSSVTAYTKNGDERRMSCDQWEALPLSERLRFQRWESYCSPGDVERLDDHLKARFSDALAAARPITAEAFLNGQNGPYMAQAANPQFGMYRISQTAAKQIINAGDAGVYRLLPKEPQQLSPTDVKHSGLHFELYREFAIRHRDLGALDKWVDRDLPVCLPLPERAPRANKHKHEMGL